MSHFARVPYPRGVHTLHIGKRTRYRAWSVPLVETLNCRRYTAVSTVFSKPNHHGPTETATKTPGQNLLYTQWVSAPNGVSLQRRHMSMTYLFSPEFPPVGYAQQLLESVHDYTGLPWWATIILTTWTIRSVVTLPLAVYSLGVINKVQNLQPEIQQLSTDLKKEIHVAVQKLEWDEKLARHHYRINMKRLIKELYIRENCHPFKASIVAWVQLPLWFSLSIALRNMTGTLSVGQLVPTVPCPELATEGILWFTNLILPDMTLILPVVVGLTNLFILEMHSLKPQVTRLEKFVTNLMRGMSLMMIPIGCVVPSCMCLYWASSSVFGLVQTLSLKHPAVRRAVRLQPTKHDSLTPYSDMWHLAKAKFGRKPKSQKDGDSGDKTT